MLNRIVRLGPATLAVAAIMVLAQPAEGQNINIAGGLSIPTSGIRNTHDMGWNVTAGVGFSMPATSLGFRFEGFYNDFKAETGNNHLRVAGGNANVVYDLGTGVARPYVIGGLGAYNQRFSNTGSSTDFGINAGAGVRFGLIGMSVYTEARLHTMSGNNQFVPIVFGVQF